jgi:hypothetical protein
LQTQGKARVGRQGTPQGAPTRKTDGARQHQQPADAKAAANAAASVAAAAAAEFVCFDSGGLESVAH